jgi:hypothetical protein
MKVTDKTSSAWRIQAELGERNYRDGYQSRTRRGAQSEFIATRLNPLYYELVARGRVFIYSTPAAGIAFAAVTTTNQFGIWNMAGSGMAFIPFKFCVGVVSGAAAIAGTVGIYTSTNLGSHRGTGCPISTWTDITPVNANLGPNRFAPIMRFATTNTLAAAPTLFRTMVYSQFQSRPANAQPPQTMAGSSFPTGEMVDDVSTPILLPGSGLFLAANTAMALTCVISVVGAEVPIALMS